MNWSYSEPILCGWIPKCVPIVWGLTIQYMHPGYMYSTCPWIHFPDFSFNVESHDLVVRGGGWLQMYLYLSSDPERRRVPLLDRDRQRTRDTWPCPDTYSSQASTAQAPDPWHLTLSGQVHLSARTQDRQRKHDTWHVRTGRAVRLVRDRHRTRDKCPVWIQQSDGTGLATDPRRMTISRQIQQLDQHRTSSRPATQDHG